MRHCRRRCGGFSLVELLVVVGIIGLLLALLFPALSAARARAETRRAGVAENGTKASWNFCAYVPWPRKDCLLLWAVVAISHSDLPWATSRSSAALVSSGSIAAAASPEARR